AAQLFEVRFHAVGIDQQLLDDAGEAVEREVEVDGGVRRDAALDGRVRNVPLVPQGDVFQRRHDGGADQAREAGEVFGEYRIALVGHGGGALLPFGEIFLGFQHFGALQVADL